MGTYNNITALTKTLDAMMAKDDRIVLYGEDAGYEGGVFRATKGLQEKYGKERVFDAPIAEAAIMGTAIGMAMNGLRPIVEMQFSGFSLPAFQQLFVHAARMRNRSRSRFTCPLVVRMPVGGGIRALEHHSEALEAIFGHIPGLKVVMPSTPYDTKGLLAAAINDPDPVIFLEPKRIYRAFKQEIPEDLYEIEIGKAAVVKEGKDITVVTYGSMVRETQKALAQVEADVELIDLRTISPLDRQTVIQSVKKTGRLLVIHEAVQSFSVSSEIITSVTDEAFLYLEAPPARLTGYDITVPLAKNEPYFMITPAKISDKIKQVMAYQI